MAAARYTKVPLGQLQPGDEIYELGRTSRQRGSRIGVVRSATKDVPSRSVNVQIAPVGGFCQNWAAKVWVRREAS